MAPPAQPRPARSRSAPKKTYVESSDDEEDEEEEFSEDDESEAVSGQSKALAGGR